MPKGPYTNNSGLPDSLDVETSVLDEPCMNRDDGSDAAQEQRGLCAWHPRGSCLALAGRSSVLLKHRPGTNGDGAAAGAADSSEDLDRSVWREEVLVGGNGPSHAAGAVSMVAWSPCGRFLASGGTDRQVVLWSMDAQDVVATWPPSTHALTGVAFLVNSACSNDAACPLLALADTRGRVGVWGVNPKLSEGKGNNNKKKTNSSSAALPASSSSASVAAEVDSDNESPLKLKRASQGKRLKKSSAPVAVATPSKGGEEFDTDDEKAKMGFVSSKVLLNVANGDDDEDFDFVTDDEAEKIAGGGKAAEAVAKSPLIEEEAAEDDGLNDDDVDGGAKNMEDDDDDAEAEGDESKPKKMSAKERLAAAMAPASEAQEKGGSKSAKKAAKKAKAEAKKAKNEALKLKKKKAKKEAAAAGEGSDDNDDDFNDSAEDELDSDEGSDNDGDDDSDDALNSASEDEDDVKAYAASDKKSSSKEDGSSKQGAKATTKADLNDDSDDDNSDDNDGNAFDDNDDNDGDDVLGPDDAGEGGLAWTSVGALAGGGATASPTGGAVAAAPAPFMPSASPLGEERRYLCWNAVGTITSRSEGAANAVEIEFADAASRRSVRF